MPGQYTGFIQKAEWSYYHEHDDTGTYIHKITSNYRFYRRELEPGDLYVLTMPGYLPTFLPAKKIKYPVAGYNAEKYEIEDDESDLRRNWAEYFDWWVTYVVICKRDNSRCSCLRSHSILQREVGHKTRWRGAARSQWPSISPDTGCMVLPPGAVDRFTHNRIRKCPRPLRSGAFSCRRAFTVFHHPLY